MAYINLATVSTNCDRISSLTVAGLAQSVERFTAEREVAGLYPGAGPLVRVLK